MHDFDQPDGELDAQFKLAPMNNVVDVEDTIARAIQLCDDSELHNRIFFTQTGVFTDAHVAKIRDNSYVEGAEFDDVTADDLNNLVKVWRELRAKQEEQHQKAMEIVRK